MRFSAWWKAALVTLVATGTAAEVAVAQQGRAIANAASESIQIAASPGQCTELNAFFSELLALTNEARRGAGLGEVQFAYNLGKAAQGYAEDLANQSSFGHVGEDGSTLMSRMAEAGYDFSQVGENIAAGQLTAQSVFDRWMESPEHRANILKAEFTEVGFGMFDNTGRSDYGRYWVQNFGKSNTSSEVAEPFIPAHCGS